MPAILPYLLLKCYRDPCAGRCMRVMAVLFFLVFSVKGFGQQENSYDEVSVVFTVPRIGNTEIPALIKNEEAWLALREVFDYLKIKNTASTGLDSLSGFFIDPKAAYLIDKPHDRILYGAKVFDLSSSDLVQTETGLYLRSAVLYPVFGLDCQFSFRNLSLVLKTTMELPALREMQQEQLRKNISQLKGEKKADTTLKRGFSFLHFGMADWSVTATQETNRPNYLRAGLSLGATLAGGEAAFNLNYYNGQPFQLRDQNYHWRYVNNDLSVFKQILVGRLATQTVSSLLAPLNGIQVTNTPTTYRKSFGSYRYTGSTEPEWMVELYVNNVLVNYVKADASGFFAFDIPIIYGNSAIRLKFYGPWGEENTREETISIPFNFLPVRQLEYTASAGIVEDERKSRFSRAGVNYGLSRRITLGGGAEYLSSAMDGRPMPFVNTSMRLFDGMILNGEYAQGVRTRAALNYRLPSNWQLDLSYTQYDKEQTAIRYNYLEERKASLSAPIHLKKFTALSRLTYNQYVLSKFRYSNAELLLSSSVAGVSTNLRTYAQFSGGARPFMYSNLSAAFRLPYGIRFSPQVQYQCDGKSFTMIKADAEKRISERGYLNLSYENNPGLRSSSITLGLRFDLSFAHNFISVRRGNGTTTASQSASGSLVYEGKAGYVSAGNQATVGRGGFIVVPFLDLNLNGRRDGKEPRVDGLKLRVNGGRIERREDSTLVIAGLEAYASYLIELDKSSFDNIAWQIKNTTIRATVEPDRFRWIEVPVAVLGEASGRVYLEKGKLRKGLSRILVNFYDGSSRQVAKTLTEEDGYFSYLGLAPGRYTARIDPAQSGLLKLSAAPDSVSFQIASSEEGVVADGFEFVLRPLAQGGMEEQERRENRAVTSAEEKKGRTMASDSAVSKKNDPSPFNQAPRSERKAAKAGKGSGKVVLSEQKPIAADTLKNGIQGEPGKAGENQRVTGQKNPEPGKTLVLDQNNQADTGNRRPVRNSSSLPKSSSLFTKRPPAGSRHRQPSLLPTRERLAAEQRSLEQRSREVFRNLKQLLEEQQQLIKKQRALIEEIRQLKQQLRKGKISL